MLQRIASLLKVTPPTPYDTGYLRAHGPEVPADDTPGYEAGCVFAHTDGDSANTVLYVNVGDVDDCNFDPIIPIIQQDAIANPAAAAALTTDLTGVDTGTDMTAAQAAQIETDLAALKAGIDANNAAIDSIIAALEEVGIIAE